MTERLQRAPRKASARSMIPLTDAQRNAQLEQIRGNLHDDDSSLGYADSSGGYEPEQAPPRVDAPKDALKWVAAGAGEELPVDIHGAEVAAETAAPVMVDLAAAEDAAEHMGDEVSGDGSGQALAPIIDREELRKDPREEFFHVLSSAAATGDAAIVPGHVLTWARDTIAAALQGGFAAWGPMPENPTEGQSVIAMARYQTATAGFPRIVSWTAGAWRIPGRELGEPMVCWACIPREALPEWPAEPR